jgi:hypothetical protein
VKAEVKDTFGPKARLQTSLFTAQPEAPAFVLAGVFLSCEFATIPTRCVSEGSCFCVLHSVWENPSLTRRVMMIPFILVPLIFGSLIHRNF